MTVLCELCQTPFEAPEVDDSLDVEGEHRAARRRARGVVRRSGVHRRIAREYSRVLELRQAGGLGELEVTPELLAAVRDLVAS